GSGAGRSDGDGDGVDDEEERRWEEEQVRKGLGRRRDDGNVNANANVNVVQNVGVRPRDVYTSGVGDLSIGGSGMWASGSGSDTLTIAQQAELSKKALHAS
ncbi:hypothetical protein Tco_0549929, partial [Tanacetum coccineum]